MTRNGGAAGIVRSMKPGDPITVVAFSMDGSRRRWWRSVIEALDDRCLRTLHPGGTTFHGPKGGWATAHHVRTYYWFERCYNLLELYDAAGALAQIYVNIASPARIVAGDLHDTDYELDVFRRPGEAPIIDDQEEFEQAVAEGGATPGVPRRLLSHRRRGDRSDQQVDPARPPVAPG